MLAGMKGKGNSLMVLAWEAEGYERREMRGA